MIEKVIHYCWFGGNPKSKLIQDCIKSWKKYLPDYKIIEWNERNFDINCCQYIREAYKAKKWAFVSDYARCYILYHHGGLYFDTDVEILRPMDDCLNSPLVAMEDDHTINTGLIMYCEAGNDFCKWMLESYEKDKFIKEDGTYNLYTVCERGTEYFTTRGFVCENKLQNVAGFTVYPTEYFCPYRHGEERIVTENTYTFHHYAASWFPKKEKFKRKIQRIIGKKGTQLIVTLKHIIRGK